jgi:hypothetical protein
VLVERGRWEARLYLLEAVAFKCTCCCCTVLLLRRLRSSLLWVFCDPRLRLWKRCRRRVRIGLESLRGCNRVRSPARETDPPFPASR